MNDRAETRLFILAGLTIAGLSVALHDARKTIKEQQRDISRKNAALDVLGRAIPYLMEQIPDEVEMPVKIVEDMQAFMLFAKNDLF